MIADIYATLCNYPMVWARCSKGLMDGKGQPGLPFRYASNDRVPLR